MTTTLMLDNTPRIAILLLALLAACTSGEVGPSPAAIRQEPTPIQTASQPAPSREPPASTTPTPSPQPTNTSTPSPNAAQPAFIPPTIDEIPLDEVTSFAAFPGNKAKGQAAPDFSANLMDGSTFTLSEARDTFILLIPTVVGCGPCMFNLEEITTVYPAYQYANLDVLVLDIYAPDAPEVWESYAALFPQVTFSWGVVDSMDFLQNYNLTGLGDVLLIAPDNELVFWSKHPLLADEYRVLFDLAVEANEINSD